MTAESAIEPPPGNTPGSTAGYDRSRDTHSRGPAVPGGREVPRQPAPRAPVRWTTAPPGALDLLAHARRTLAESAEATAPNERYAAAHLAALRTAAAVLAARARPEEEKPGRRRPPRSAWHLLPQVAPELTEWAGYFASGASKRARAEAGLPNAATAREADDLMRDVEVFMRLVVRLLGLPPLTVVPQQTD
ncbi:MAG TPA: SAV_6107 family HEPN domain-containing protein [Yinghuangia sp.]|uniref:SAV_6107 family HEPN domain-containing protein n=1 Tax=Yinghuangia sp. YIM S10712 TaxID=3436930 RepID=UPI002C8737D0|nr:SAV_6107 family HEPN domain-containing protein [Yinghuangia sp.]